MGAREQLIDVKLGQAKEICESLKSDLDRYENRGRVTSAGESIVEALRRGMHGLLGKLSQLESSDQLSLLPINIIESRIHTATRPIQTFIEILSLLESSQIRDVPYEVASPLRKQIQELFPDSDLLVVSETQLNYSIIEIGKILKDQLSGLDCEIPDELPKRIFRVSIPSMTYKEALLVSIFGHEMGHPMYKKRDVEESISVDVDKELLNDYVKEKKKEKVKHGMSIEKPDIRKEITENINNTIKNWIEEIYSDIFGLKIFGPSYVYAFVHFISNISRLDSSKSSHPPPRLRLKFLIEELEKSFSIYTATSNKTRSFVKEWREIGNKGVNFGEDEERIAYVSITKNETYNQIVQLVDRHIPNDMRYEDDQFKFDLDNLITPIYNKVPPVEIKRKGQTETTGMVSILNSGWDSYIRGLEDFEEPSESKENELSVFEDFNRFVLKSLELSDIRESWNNASTNIGR